MARESVLLIEDEPDIVELVQYNLERVGDLAVNIAKRARSLAAAGPTAIPEQLTEMMERCTGMLRDSLDAFVRGDVAQAREVCESDDAVDALNRAVIAVAIQEMNADPERIEQGISVISASKALERIADHATNVAEDVVYLVSGEIIRHGGGSG